jgi:hypothetical protein
MELSTHVCDLEDMVEIDEMVQDLLADWLEFPKKFFYNIITKNKKYKL